MHLQNMSKNVLLLRENKYYLLTVPNQVLQILRHSIHYYFDLAIILFPVGLTRNSKFTF